MSRVIVKYLSGSRANTTEVFPTQHFQSLYIGRDPSCDIRFDLDEDDLVSRSHAMIEWDGETSSKFTITDLLSSNGTFLNGKRVVDATPLATGDTLRMGQTGPEVEISLENTPQTHEWIDGENIAFDDNKRTRVQQAVPDDPEAARAALNKRKGTDWVD